MNKYFLQHQYQFFLNFLPHNIFPQEKLSELFGKSTKAKREVVEAINNNTHRITIQKWKDDGDDCFALDYADVQKDGTITVPKDFGRLPKKYRIELEQFLQGGK